MVIPSQSAAGFSADLPADLSDRQVQKHLSPAARKAFFKIAAAWKIRDEEAKQLLGGISNGAFYQMKAGEAKTPLDQDRLTRVSLLGRNLQGFEPPLQPKAGRRLDLAAEQQSDVRR